MPCEGKTLSVRNTKGESTDGHDGGGSSGSSDEALVTSGERSGCSKTAVANRAIGTSDRFQRRLSSQGGRAMASRVNREVVLWAAGGEIPPADPAAWNPCMDAYDCQSRKSTITMGYTANDFASYYL